MGSSSSNLLAKSPAVSVTEESVQSIKNASTKESGCPYKHDQVKSKGECPVTGAREDDINPNNMVHFFFIKNLLFIYYTK